VSLPCIAVVGRPNVGKSSLFNRLTRTRQALVHDTSGVTRDRIYGEVRLERRKARLIDTGGLVPGHEDKMEDHIKDQVETALEEADLVLFVVDGRAGVTPMDEEVAAALRPRGLPVLLVINKVDDVNHADSVHGFHELGFEDMHGFSALHGYNSAGLVRAIEERLPEDSGDGDDDADRPLRVAFVGKPNVGKSSLINHLVEQDRLIVSDVAGTTRESVEVPFSLGEDSRPMVLVDTAGLRRRSKIKRGVEKLMRVSTERSIRMADIVVLMLDGSAPLSHQDKHIAGLVQKARKPGILAVNKIDLFGDVHADLIRWYSELDYDMAWFDYAPRVPLSAHDGRGVRDLLEALAKIRDNFDFRIPTSRLNKLVREALLVHPPPTRKGRTLNLLYAHQRKEWPASFTFKVNDPKLVHFSFQRYLENLLRQYGEFEGFPLVVHFQSRDQTNRKPKPLTPEEQAALDAAEAATLAARAAPASREITRKPRRRKGAQKKPRAKVRTPSKPLSGKPTRQKKAAPARKGQAGKPSSMTSSKSQSGKLKRRGKKVRK
jgi:GTP-binding protein